MKDPLPRIIFGSSALGNLYEVVPDETKREIVRNWLRHQPYPVIDSAGKYGAGLALSSIGRFLEELEVDPRDVTISNKLGWQQIPLTTKEPLFEGGVWAGLTHDAKQTIGYQGILDCYEQGNALLGSYPAKLVSVHDPDEYLAAATDEKEEAKRYNDILDAYRALNELRQSGEVEGVGIGSKDWRVIDRLYQDGALLDWVMIANSLTLLRHPREILDFVEKLHAADVTVINSAVFNAGFLLGGKYFDYAVVTKESHPELFTWRDSFLQICADYQVNPAHACCQFALSPPGVAALALNTSNPARVPDNVAMVQDTLASSFWDALRAASLLSSDYPYL